MRELKINMTVDKNIKNGGMHIGFDVPSVLEGIAYQEMSEIPGRAAAVIVERIAEEFIEKHRAEILAAINPVAISNLAIAQAANRIAGIFEQSAKSAERVVTTSAKVGKGWND